MTDLQSVSQEQESDASGGSGRSRASGSSAGKKRKRESGSKGANAEALIVIEGDEPAQLITMQPVSHLLALPDASILMPELTRGSCCQSFTTSLAVHIQIHAMHWIW